MGLVPLAKLLFSIALAGAAATGVPATTPTALTAPEPIVSRHAEFAIPFRVDTTADPARQPAEVQLLVSTDRGKHWQLYTKAPPTERQFLFRAGGNGEYWFAIRTVDRLGQVRPTTIVEPGLRVRVELAASSTKSPPQREAVARRPATSHGKTTEASSASEDKSPETRGSVAIAINPAIGKNRTESDSHSMAGADAGLPPGERPRAVNSRFFQLEYEVDSVGPSGIGRVELWGTRDGGKTWRRFSVDNDNRTPLLVNVEEEGVYGFRVVVANGAGLGGGAPVDGELPDLWVAVDLHKPTARMVSAQQGTGSESGHLIISWQADDWMLAARPISLAFRVEASAPWLPVASGLENTGRYAWPIDNRTPAQFSLRLEVRDEAGNVGIHESSEPIIIDQSRPTVRVRDVRAIEDSATPPSAN